MYSTILFDLDGTLTDPRQGITKSVQFALRKMGIHEPELSRLIHFIGPPLAKSFQVSYGMSPDQSKMAVHYYREYFSETGIYENILFPGIRELLEQLQLRGKKLAVATSKPEVFARTILQHFSLESFFVFIAGSNLDGSRVEKAEVISYALQNVPPCDFSEIVMVGDREYDVIGAKANGIDSLAVGYGFGSQEELFASEPTYFAETFDAMKHRLFA